jgi:aspartyl-tRNA(Asn)/glutamyl-tRNA(Gln) amidotransferase subunit A
MITLKEALKLSEDELKDFKSDLAKKIEENKELGGYIEQLTGDKITDFGAGIPIAIKDNIGVKGWDTTCCSKILQNYVAPFNATVVENLLKHNLSPFGRTNMDEFAMGSSTETSYYGKTKNPHNSSRVPGGSSGGSAAVVGAGLAIAALGTDTGGSIRQPAAFCGCVGLKPTYGRVSRYGVTAYSSSLDQVGPITQNVEDCAILYDMISGHDPLDSTSADVEYTKTAENLNPNRKLKIAVIKNYIDGASEDTQKAINETVEKLKADGHEIIYKDLTDTAHHISSYYIIATAEASSNLSRFDGVRYGNRADSTNLKELYENTRSEGFGEEVKRRILLGTFVLSSGYYDAYYVHAQKVRHIIKNEFEETFKDCDLILSPVAPTTAFEFGAVKGGLEMFLEDIFTISVNLTGLPAISLPVGKDKDGMPVGMQLIAKHFDEQTLLDGALITENLVNNK